MYILFEGVDTSGKTTQIELLKKVYPDAIYTKEPGGTSIGLELRSLLLDRGLKSYIAEMYLFLADRAEHYQEVIKPNRKRLIISDRGFISGIAYAITNHPNLDMNFLLDLNRFAFEGDFPDKVFLFKTTKELILSRMSERSEDAIEKRGIEYLLKVQENMQKTLETLDVEYHLIDSSKSMEDIEKEIKGYLL
jgi:dTMP kinase